MIKKNNNPMEKLNALKRFTSILFDNKQKYLFYSKKCNSWYFVSSICDNDLNSDVSDCVVSEVKFKDPEYFFNLFNEYFSKLFVIVGDRTDYFFVLSKLNKVINDGLKNKKIDDSVVTEDIVQYQLFDVEKLVSHIKNEVTDYNSFFEKSIINLSNLLPSITNFIDIKKIELDPGTSDFNDLKFRLHFLNGQNCVSNRYRNITETLKFFVTVYTSTHRVFRYTVNFEDADISLTIYQPFVLFSI